MDKMRKSHYLNAMAITEWSLRNPTKKKTDRDTLLKELRAKVDACKACSLYKTRTQAVFGVGSHTPELLVVGEAPGEQEDLKGEPFVGRAGKLLDEMLYSIGLDRSKIYITNILKSRPPMNRNPAPEEVAACTPYLEQQVEILQPKVILALGRFAAHYLLNTSISLTELRKRTHKFRGTDVTLVVSYHPAFLLRSPQNKKEAYRDLSHLKTLLESLD